MLTVTPGAVGAPPAIAAIGYYKVDNRVTTVPGAKSAVDVDRAVNGDTLVLTGTIGVESKPERLRVGIDDPAHYAAWRLTALLRARGVKVLGPVTARHRMAGPGDDPAQRGAAPPARAPEPAALARLTPPPLIEDVAITNKVSQNLHAELFLRRIGLVAGSGSIADGQVAVRAMLTAAGVPRAAYDFSDGSGMSTYNRVTPRGTVTLLRWAAAQPWGEAWRATLPVGGRDGTLVRRFKGTPLDGKLFAKTGSLNATAALAGYLVAASGRTLTFAAYANDVPDGESTTREIDAALLRLAAAN